MQIWFQKTPSGIVNMTTIFRDYQSALVGSAPALQTIPSAFISGCVFEKCRVSLMSLAPLGGPSWRAARRFQCA
jgi:hypothetical protein